MVDECCGWCSEFQKTVVNFKRDASNEESAKSSSHFLLKSLDTSSDFTFPIYGNSLQDSYKGGFGYVPVIESSGVAFIVYPDSTQQNTMFNSVILWLPVLFLLPMVTAYVPAVIIWILVSHVWLFSLVNFDFFNFLFILKKKDVLTWNLPFVRNRTKTMWNKKILSKSSCNRRLSFCGIVVHSFTSVSMG